MRIEERRGTDQWEDDEDCLCVCVCVCVWVFLCLCVSEEEDGEDWGEKSVSVAQRRERKKGASEINKIAYTQATVAVHICTVTVANYKFAQF